MTNTPSPTVRDRLATVPKTFITVAVIGVLAWFISLGSSNVVTHNGVVEACSYTDFAKIGAGLLAIALIIGGIRDARKNSKPGAWEFILPLAGLLMVNSVLLLLKGVDVIAPYCSV